MTAAGRITISLAFVSGCVPVLGGTYACENDADCTFGWSCEQGTCEAPAGDLQAGDTSSGDPRPGDTLAGDTQAGDTPPGDTQSTDLGPSGDAHPAQCPDTWTHSNVRNGAGRDATEIQIDSGGAPLIAFHDEPVGDMVLLRHDGSDWQQTGFDSTGDVGEAVSLVLDDADTAHLAYYNRSNEELVYLNACGAGCLPETLDTAVNYFGADISIALKPNGDPHIIYNHFRSNLYFADFDGLNWQLSDEQVGGQTFHIEHAIDSAGTMHVAYYDPGGSQLVYLRGAPANWQVFTTPANGTAVFVSLALDPSDAPHIVFVFYDGVDTSSLAYTRWNGNGLEPPTMIDGCPTCESAQAGNYSGLALDAAGWPHVSYYAQGLPLERGLKYARLGPSGWCTQFVHPSTTLDSTLSQIGLYTSLALDRGGAPHIAYRSGNQLRYATIP